MVFFFFQEEYGRRVLFRSRGLGEVYKRRPLWRAGRPRGGGGGLRVRFARVVARASTEVVGRRAVRASTKTGRARVWRARLKVLLFGGVRVLRPTTGLFRSGICSRVHRSDRPRGVARFQGPVPFLFFVP